MLPKIAEVLEMPSSNREGWLTGLFNKVSSTESEYEIAVAFPTQCKNLPKVICVDGIKCYPFYEKLDSPENYDDNLEAELAVIIEEVKPDILHIFGTEFPHSLAGARAFNNPKRTLVGIQGVCSKIAEDYMALIPPYVVSRATFRDRIRHDSIKRQQDKFFLRGESETKLLELTLNHTGRTTFDEEHTRMINPSRNYYKMNETMRPSFYDGRWSVDKIVPHTIFLGQGDYPIKGFHFLLKALPEVVSQYPDVKVKIAGNSIINNSGIKDKIKISSYGAYLRELVKKYNLESHIEVLGSLSEIRMKEAYLSSAVYVCPSYMENSPNTIAEAMLLGMPVIASNAGGIPDIISDNEGFVFKRGESKALAELLCKVFDLEKNSLQTIQKKCECAYARAHKDYAPDANLSKLFEIYDKIGRIC